MEIVKKIPSAKNIKLHSWLENNNKKKNKIKIKKFKFWNQIKYTSQFQAGIWRGRGCHETFFPVNFNLQNVHVSSKGISLKISKQTFKKAHTHIHTMKSGNFFQAFRLDKEFFYVCVCVCVCVVLLKKNM